MKYIDYNNYYKRFEAEHLIKELAIDFSHSYHICVFVCGREFEKKNYQLYSAQFAQQFTQTRVNSILKVSTDSDVQLVLEKYTGRFGAREFNIIDDQADTFFQGAPAKRIQIVNYAFLYFGNVGGEQDPDANILSKFFKHLHLKQDKMKLYSEFPTVLDLIRQEDPQFEKATSKTIQKLKLYHGDSTHNPNLGRDLNSAVGKSIGILVVNTHCLGKEYKPGLCKSTIAGRHRPLQIESEIKVAKRLFFDLQVDDVQVLHNKNKFEIIRSFKQLKFESNEFKKVHSSGKVLVFIIRWIGWDITNDAFTSQSCFFFGGFKHYGLTVEGKPIDVDDCCLFLAEEEDTRVMLIQDKDDSSTIKNDFIDQTEPLSGITYEYGQKYSQQGPHNVLKEVVTNLLIKERVL